MIDLDCASSDSIFRRVDRWTEVLGPVLKPEWIQLEGVPLHTWDERVFTCLGECLGTVMEVDTKAKQRKRMDMVRVLILSDPLQSLPESLVLEVSRLDSVSI